MQSTRTSRSRVSQMCSVRSVSEESGGPGFILLTSAVAMYTDVSRARCGASFLPSALTSLTKIITVVELVLNTTSLVLNTTSRCRKASRSFKILRRRVITRLETVLERSDASHFSACEETFRNTLRCSWLRLIGWFGLPRNADVTSLSEGPTDHEVTIAHFAARHFLSRVAVSTIRCRA